MSGSADWKGRSLHLVGIGGAGMSALARIAVGLGASVTGSDRADSAELTDLRSLGIGVTVGSAPDAIPDGAELVWSSAVDEADPERQAAARRGLRQLHRSELLAELTRLKRTIAVTGTHGKTTTSAMVLSALRGAGEDPAWAIGAPLHGGPNAGWGESDLFVVEADESDRSLLALEAAIAVLTNCELDHHTTYASLDDLRETISTFLSGSDAAVVWDRPDLVSLVPGGVALHPYDAGDASSGPDGARFSWHGREVALAVPGVHNAINAAGALEAAVAAGVDPEGAVAGVEAFAGTGRRFEAAGRTAAGAELVDDYAHHPTEVEATIAAARSLGPGRVVAVFQPHLFSRTAAFVDEFGRALAGADLGFILDVYPAREAQEDFPGVGAGMLVEAANRSAGADLFRAAGGIDGAAAMIGPELRDGDLCLLLGAGDVNRLAARLVG